MPAIVQNGNVYGETPTNALTTSDVLSTVDECTASTTASNVAGASALAELSDSFTSILDCLAVGSDDRTSEIWSVSSGVANNELIPIYRATKDCIIHISGYVNFPAIGNSGLRAANILVDNTPLFASGNTLNIEFNLPLSGLFFLKSGQVLKVQVVQNSGSTMDCGIYYAKKVMEL